MTNLFHASPPSSYAPLRYASNIQYSHDPGFLGLIDYVAIVVSHLYPTNHHLLSSASRLITGRKYLRIMIHISCARSIQYAKVAVMHESEDDIQMRKMTTSITISLLKAPSMLQTRVSTMTPTLRGEIMTVVVKSVSL